MHENNSLKNFFLIFFGNELRFQAQKMLFQKVPEKPILNLFYT